MINFIKNNKNYFGAVITFIVVMVVMFGFIQLIDLGIDKLRVVFNISDNEINNIRETSPIQIKENIFSDFQSLSSLDKEILIENKLSNMENKDDEDLTKNLKAYGDFSKIYLFAEISVNERPLTDWDSIYIKFNNYIDNTLEEFNSGGHLFRPKSLSVPQIKTTTRLLFNASVVPYIPTIPYSEARIPATINWFENVFRNPQNHKKEREIRFDTFLSTTERGMINNISLFYKCSKDTPDCYIEIIKNEEKSD